MIESEATELFGKENAVPAFARKRREILARELGIAIESFGVRPDDVVDESSDIGADCVVVVVSGNGSSLAMISRDLSATGGF